VSLDRRLREELQRDAERIVPELERSLGIVEARARRRSSPSAATLLLAAAVVVAAIIVRLGVSDSSSVGPASSPSTSVASSLASIAPTSPLASFGAIAGTYTVTLDPENASVAQYKLGGLWTMRLAATGEIFLSPPPTFGSGTSSLSGLAFTLAGDRFRNNIFYSDYCSSVATYTWSLTAAELRFAPVGETCAMRQTLLAMLPWQVTQ
jgi:hypothetical protein